MKKLKDLCTIIGKQTLSFFHFMVRVAFFEKIELFQISWPLS